MSSGSSYPVRRKPRLRNYDYATPGMYFITICIRHRLPLLGRIVEGDMQLSPAGVMVQEVWEAQPAHYPGISIDAFIVMPNHVHGIVVIEEAEAGSERLSLADVVHRFKSLTTARYRAGVKTEGWPPFPGTLWQQGYFDHVIRTDTELDQVRRYIVENVQRWALDRENPEYSER
jgi:REP element-mobilizing transposase RayT